MFLGGFSGKEKIQKILLSETLHRILFKIIILYINSDMILLYIFFVNWRNVSVLFNQLIKSIFFLR